MAKDTKPKSAPDPKGKDKKAKGKKGKNAAANDAERPLSVAAHPRAKSHVRRAKGFGGLVGFMLAAILSVQASVPFVVSGERALVAGLAGYLVGWACSVTVWRQLMVAELRAAAEEVTARRAEAAARGRES